MPAMISLRAYARHRGCSLHAVQQAIAAGRLAGVVVHDKNGHPKIRDAAEADALWAKTTDASKQRGQDAVSGAFASAKAVRETYRSRLAKLEYDKAIGAVVDAAEVRSTFFSLSRTVRDALLGIPDRTSAILAAESDPRRCHEIIDAEINAALTALADGDQAIDRIVTPPPAPPQPVAVELDPVESQESDDDADDDASPAPATPRPPRRSSPRSGFLRRW